MVKLFAHRGFVTPTHPENSIASLNEAVSQGFKAIEFDLCFAAQKLVLKHDEPSESEAKILPDLGKYLAYKNQMSYWLDFKNLTEENCLPALLEAKREIEFFGVKLDQIYFAPYVLEKKTAQKIFTCIKNIFGPKAKIVAVCESLKNQQETKNLRAFLDKNNVKYLSIFHQLLNANSMKIFAGIEILAWTVNDLTKLKELEALGVKNFATDTITPQIYKGKTPAQNLIL